MERLPSLSLDLGREFGSWKTKAAVRCASVKAGARRGTRSEIHANLKKQKRKREKMKRKGIIAVAVVALVLAGRANADENTTTTQKIIIVTNTVTGNVVTNYTATSTAVTTTPTAGTTTTTYAGGTGDTSSTWSDRWKYDKENHTKFMPNEGSIDLFGSYATRDRYGNGEDGWGGGIGLNYFLTRYVGIGADSYIEEWKVPYRVNGSLLIRLPID